MVGTPAQADHSAQWVRALTERSATVMGVPVQRDDQLYFTLRLADWRTHRVVRVPLGAGLAQARTVVDPDTLLPGGTVADWQLVGTRILVAITDGTEFGSWVVVDPDTGRPTCNPFGDCRDLNVAYQEAEAGRPDRVYYVSMQQHRSDTVRRVRVREGVAGRPAGSAGVPRDAPVRLAPAAWDPTTTMLPRLSVQSDGDDRWLVVHEVAGIAQLARTSVYDLTDPASPERPPRVAYLDTTSPAHVMRIRDGWAYFTSTDHGRQPYGAVLAAPVRALNERDQWRTVVPGDRHGANRLVDFSVDSDRVTITRRHHGVDEISVHRLETTPRGPVAGRTLEATRAPDTPFAATGGSAKVTDPTSKRERRMMSWVGPGGPRLYWYGLRDGVHDGQAPREWEVSSDVRAALPTPTKTVTWDVPFRFGERGRHGGVVRLTVSRSALRNNDPPAVLMTDNYPYYGLVQGGRQATTTLYHHMVDDAVHEAGGATASVYHDNPRPGAAGVEELTEMMTGAAETLVRRRLARPGRMVTMGGSAEAHAAVEAVRTRPDLFAGTVVRSGLLRLDARGLARGVGFCHNGPDAFGPNAREICPYTRMREKGIEDVPGARRPVMLFAYGTWDRRTIPGDHTLPYARAAAAAGARVHVEEQPTGHFMQWAPHGGAAAFGRPLAHMAATMGGFAGRSAPRRRESAVLVAARLAMAAPVSPRRAPAVLVEEGQPPSAPTTTRSPGRERALTMRH